MSNRLRIAIVCLALGAATGANNALSPLYVIYESRFHFSSLSVTAIFATYAVAVLTALICVGRLSDDIGRRPLLIAGSLLLIGSTVLFLTSTGTIELFVGRVVLGFGTGTITATGTAALVELDPELNRSKAAVQATIANLSGAAFGPLIFGILAQYLPDPIRTPYYFELGLQLLGLVGLFAMTETATHELTAFRWRIQRPSVPPEARARFALAGVVVSTGWMIGGLYGSLSGTLDRQLLHVESHAVAGLLLFAFAFIGGSSQFRMRAQPPRRTMTIGVAAAGLGIVLVEASLLESSALLFVLATVVCGLGNGLAFMGSLALVNAIAPPLQRAELVASYNVVAYFSLSLPVIGVGLLANLLGLRSAASIFAGVIVAVAAGTLVWLRRSMPAEPVLAEIEVVVAP